MTTSQCSIRYIDAALQPLDKNCTGSVSAVMNAGSALGTTRNRTDTFLKYRNQARGISRPSDGRSDASRLLDGGSRSHLDDPDAAEKGLGGIQSAIAPRYVQFKESARVQMLEIRAKMGELRKLHGQATLTSFDDTGNKELEIEVVTQEITRIFKLTEGQLRKFGEQQSLSDSEQKVKQNVQRTLATELQKLSVQFRKQQKAHLQQLRQNKEGFGGGSWLPDASTATADDYDPGFSDMQSMQAANMDALAEERDQEVRNILSSINDLAQIMKDLSTLVIDQGTILDRIDYNMEQVSLKVEEGVGQLVRAEKTQKQSVLIMCIMVLIVLVIAMSLIVVLRYTLF